MQNIFPIAYFGSVGYYQKLVEARNVCFELHEHYVKQSLRNRMRILGPNGVQELSIPVVKPNGSKTITGEIQLFQRENWQKIHWKAIETAYGSSPYFDHYGIEIHELIHQPETNLAIFNQQIHTRICSWLELPIDSSYTESYTISTDAAHDFRNSMDIVQQNLKPYTQVFSPTGKFESDLSILDAVLNLGPMARNLVAKF
jgi:hypothetical protein